MACPILEIALTKHHLPYLFRLKAKWCRTNIFWELSNEITWFLQVSCFVALEKQVLVIVLQMQ